MPWRINMGRGSAPMVIIREVFVSSRAKITLFTNRSTEEKENANAKITKV